MKEIQQLISRFMFAFTVSYTQVYLKDPQIKYNCAFIYKTWTNERWTKLHDTCISPYPILFFTNCTRKLYISSLINSSALPFFICYKWKICTFPLFYKFNSYRGLDVFFFLLFFFTKLRWKGVAKWFTPNHHNKSTVWNEIPTWQLLVGSRVSARIDTGIGYGLQLSHSLCRPWKPQGSTSKTYS